MERFATPLPCIYTDGEQEESRGQLGIYSALTFKRFQQLMTQKTGVHAGQLSAVLAYKRSVNGEERRQKLNINESTNFGIILRIHAKEIDAHFVISLKRSKKDRKGAARRRVADVDDAEDDVTSESPFRERPDEAAGVDQRPALQAKPEPREPMSPVSILPDFPGLLPPSPQSPGQSSPETRQNHPAERSNGTAPWETPPSDADVVKKPVFIGRLIAPEVKDLSGPTGSEVPAKPALTQEGPQTPVNVNKPVTVLQRPLTPVASADGRRAEGTPAQSPPVHSPDQSRGAPSPAFWKQSEEQPALNDVTSSSGRSQQHQAPGYPSRGFSTHRQDRAIDSNAKSHGSQAAHPSASEKRPMPERHVATQARLDGARNKHPTPGPQIVSASMFASAVNAATEALAPRRTANHFQHVAGRAPGHVAVGGPTSAEYRPRRELTPLEMAGLQGVLKDFAAATGRREGFAGFRRTCKFCVFCLERQRCPPPFHWCVDDRVVSGFRGPSPAGPIERPVKRTIEAAA